MADTIVGFLVREYPGFEQGRKNVQLLPLTYNFEEDDGTQDIELER